MLQAIWLRPGTEETGINRPADWIAVNFAKRHEASIWYDAVCKPCSSMGSVTAQALLWGMLVSCPHWARLAQMILQLTETKDKLVR